MRIKKLPVALIFLLILGAVRCATNTQMVKEDDEAVLKKRVQEYWTYRIKGQWDKAYAYESPDSRKSLALPVYKNQNGRSIVKWEDFDIIEIWTSGDTGRVKMNTKIRYLIPETKKSSFENKAVFKRVIEEKWIKSEGKWFRLGAGA